jgi:hypothetical protein
MRCKRCRCQSRQIRSALFSKPVQTALDAQGTFRLPSIDCCNIDSTSTLSRRTSAERTVGARFPAQHATWKATVTPFSASPEPASAPELGTPQLPLLIHIHSDPAGRGRSNLLLRHVM